MYLGDQIGLQIRTRTNLVGGGKDGSTDVLRQCRHPVVQLLVLGDGEATFEALCDVIKIKFVKFVVELLLTPRVQLVPEGELETNYIFI